MTFLANSFPESFRREFSLRNLKLGSVIKTFDKAAKKEKWHIVIGFDDESISTATVRINSEKNENVFRTDYLKSLCHSLKKEKVSFLDWDSFVDCSHITEWQTNVFQEIIKENPACLLGKIDQIELDAIRSILATARTIEKKKKRKYHLI